jgi:hypothetical protein
MTTPKQPATEAERFMRQWGPRDDMEGGTWADMRDDLNKVRAEAAAGLLALREALADARLTLIAAAEGKAFDIRLRPSVLRRHVADVDKLLADTATAAAEIEAPIRADERAKMVALADKMLDELAEALREAGVTVSSDWAAQQAGYYARSWFHDQAIREQPATEEAE